MVSPPGLGLFLSDHYQFVNVKSDYAMLTKVHFTFTSYLCAAVKKKKNHKVTIDYITLPE